MRYAGFFVSLFTAGEKLSFFMTADDIDDGNLFIFEGGVENINDEFSIIDGVDDNVVVVVSAVDINDGLEASTFAISRFSNMFEFNDVFMVFCNLPSLFVGGEVLLDANNVLGMVMCSALTTTMTTMTTAWAGEGCGLEKKPVSCSQGGFNNCLCLFSENSNSTTITKLTTADDPYATNSNVRHILTIFGYKLIRQKE